MVDLIHWLYQRLQLVYKNYNVVRLKVILIYFFKALQSCQSDKVNTLLDTYR